MFLKMAERHILSELGTWVLIIIFILMITFAFFSPAEGFMPKIANIALGIQKYLPISPSKEIKQDEILPDAVKNTEKEFIADISKQSDKGNCILIVNNLNGLGDYKMEISYYQGLTARIEKPAGSEGTRKIEPVKADNENIKVCIVQKDAFIDCFLNPSGVKNCGNPIYKEMTLAQVSKDEVVAGGNKYNILPGIMFKPDNNRVCFVPQDSLIEREIRYMPQCDIFTGPITDLKLCQIMYQCFETNGIRYVSPKTSCREGGVNTRAYSEPDCNKVRDCAIRSLKQNNINVEPNECFVQSPGAEYVLSFTT